MLASFAVSAHVNSHPIRISVNGEEREVPQGTSVTGLLALMGIAGARVAVERNRDVVTKNAYDATVLAVGDRLEIVAFVGGGL